MVKFDEVLFEENGDRCLYRSPRSNRPKWMRGTSSEVRTNRAGQRYICEIGWELRPENREYTTCLRYMRVTTTWRH